MSTSSRPCAVLATYFLLLVAVFSTFSLTSAETLSSTSLCANLLPYSDVVHSYSCQTEAENALAQFPTIWLSLQKLAETAGPQGSCSTCWKDFAILTCMNVYRPNQSAPRAYIARSVCTNTVATGNNTVSSCGVSTTLIGFIQATVPSTIWDCTGPQYSDDPQATTSLVSSNVNVPVPTCQVLSPSSVCAGIINYSIYVPAGLTQATIEASLVARNVSGLWSSVSSGCSASLKKVICARAYLACDRTTLMISLTTPLTAANNPLVQALPFLAVPFPRLPCNSLCVATNASCSVEVEASPVVANILKCDGVSNIIPTQKDCAGNPIVNNIADYPTSSSVLASLSLRSASGSISLPIRSQCNAFPDVISEPLRNTSICYGYVQSYATSVTYAPYTCQDDAEAALSAASVLWGSLSKLSVLAPNSSTCSDDFAVLLCMSIYRPAGRLIHRSVCTRAMGECGVQGSCTTIPNSPLRSFIAATLASSYQAWDCSAPQFSLAPAPVTVPAPVVSPPAMQPRCERINPKSICAGVVDYEVYLPWNNNQATIEALVKDSFTIAVSLSSVKNGCQENMAKLLCSTVYLRCDTTVLSSSLSSYTQGANATLRAVAPLLPYLNVPFPQLPCRSQCEVANRLCTDLLSIPNSALPALVNCTGTSRIVAPTRTCSGLVNTGIPNYPNATTTLAALSVAGTTVAIQSSCNAFITNKTVTPYYYCPSPLRSTVNFDSSNAVLGGPCSLPCPSVAYTGPEWQRADGFTIFLTVVSFIVSTIMVLTWSIFPSKRKQTNLWMFSIAVWIIALMFIVGLGATNSHPSEIGCKDDYTDYVRFRDGGVCVFQGVVLYWSAAASVLWWSVSAIDLFIRIVLGKRVSGAQARTYQIVYQVAAWGIPTLGVFIGLGVKGFGRNTALPMCFFADDAVYWLQWTIWYYPIGFAIFLGAFTMGSIVWVMFKSAARTGTRKKAGWWKQQIRPICFILEFSLIFTFILAYRLYLWRNEREFADAVSVWVSCLMANPDRSKCTDRPTSLPPVALLWLLILSTAGQGIWNFLMFWTQKNNITLWWGLLTGKGVNVVTGAANADSSVTTRDDPSVMSKTGTATGSAGSAGSGRSGGLRDRGVEMNLSSARSQLESPSAHSPTPPITNNPALENQSPALTIDQSQI